MKNRTVGLIAAVTINGAIGRNGGLAFSVSDDLKYFRRVTEGHVVIMGRGTFESMGARPLKNRVNYVVSSQSGEGTEGVEYVPSVEEALERSAKEHPDKGVWIIGGGQVYRYCMDRGLVDRLYITQIERVVEDVSTWFPKIDPRVWKKVKGDSHFAEKEGVWLEYQVWEKR